MKKSLTFKSLCALLLIAIAVFSFTGCNTNNGDVANITEIPSSDCVRFISDNSELALDKFYSYTGAYGTEKFRISSDGEVIYDGGYGTPNTGVLCCAFVPTGYEGIMIFVKSTEHSNYGHYQYPDYDEENPHSGCYMAYYLSDISANSVTFASGVFNVENAPEGYTACADSFAHLKELFETFGYEATCTGYSTTATRAANNPYGKKVFTLAE